LSNCDKGAIISLIYIPPFTQKKPFEALTLSQLLKSGEISSVELTNKYINAIENDNPKYNAYVSTTL